MFAYYKEHIPLNNFLLNALPNSNQSELKMAHTVKIKHIHSVTHNVKQYTTEKPKAYQFTPGQATDVAINQEGFKDDKRPFTFTSLPEEEHLQFTIKSYHAHDGVTEALDGLVEGDELLIEDAWGAIKYKGKGTFIAGGAGVTPFLAILKKLEDEDKIEGHSLIFSNSKQQDVILETYFQELLGDNFISTLTEEKVDGHLNEKVDMNFLKKYLLDYSQKFYVCGPPQMVEDISNYLKALGANAESMTFDE